MKKITGFAVAALAASLIAAPASAADEIVLGLNMAKTGFLKSSGETTETAVDIAVAIAFPAALVAIMDSHGE